LVLIGRVGVAGDLACGGVARDGGDLMRGMLPSRSENRSSAERADVVRTEFKVESTAGRYFKVNCAAG
jgi:hypothetical protein